MALSINSLLRALPKKQRTSIILILVIIIAILSATGYLSQQEPSNASQYSEKLNESNSYNSQDEQDFPWTVERIVDGDTLDITNGTEILRIRLIGINAPEVHHPQKGKECLGDEATQQLTTLIEQERLAYATDPTQNQQDRYGRTLAYLIRADGLDINEEMIRRGYAYEYTYDAAYEQQERYRSAQQDAERALRGLWDPHTCPQ